jgi:hypothetical protein
MIDQLLPEGARLIHIGPHKTGSTALQVALHRVRDGLPALGAYYPAGPYRRRRAGWALGLAGRQSGTPVPPMHLWDELVAEVERAGELRACVSNEDFGRATPAQVKKIVADLGGDRVHVLAVARRLDRYLPSQWQERVKAGERRPFDQWLEVVLHGNERNWNYRNVWQAHDIEALVSRWTAVVPPERFTLVVSDDSDHRLIPRTVEEMLGLPEGLIEPVADRSNRSLNLYEAELIRRANAAVVRRGMRGARYRRLIRAGISQELIASAGSVPGPRIPLPAWALAEVRELSDRRAEAVAGLGVRVIGDPERLRVPNDVISANPDAGDAQVPLGAVAAAFGATLAKMADEIDRAGTASAVAAGQQRRSALRRLFASRR